TLVDVLVDDVRLVQHEVAFDEHRDLDVGIHDREVLGLVVEVDVDDLKVHPLLVQHDAAALTEGIGGPGIERHHVEFLLAPRDPTTWGRFTVNATDAGRPSRPRHPASVSERPSSIRASTSTQM